MEKNIIHVKSRPRKRTNVVKPRKMGYMQTLGHRIINQIPYEASEIENLGTAFLEWCRIDGNNDPTVFCHQRLYLPSHFFGLETKNSYFKDCLELGLSMVTADLRANWQKNPYLQAFSLRVLPFYSKEWAASEMQRIKSIRGTNDDTQEKSVVLNVSMMPIPNCDIVPSKEPK